MSVKTAVKVISLEASTDRRQSFAQMASDVRLEWEFFSACKNAPSPLIYSARAAIRRCGRPMSASEIGCYASHFKLWEWLTASDYDQIIILEDDVIVDWAALEPMTANNFAGEGINLLRLFSTHPFAWRIVKYRLLSPHSHLVRATGLMFGTQGYLLTKSAARILCSKYSAITAPVDWVLGRYWEHKIISYCIFPFPIVERHASSIIGESRHEIRRVPFVDRATRLAWRIKDRASRAYVESFRAKKHPLGPMRDSGDVFIKNTGR